MAGLYAYPELTRATGRAAIIKKAGDSVGAGSQVEAADWTLTQRVSEDLGRAPR
jgi:hypothetical protein